MSFTFGSLFAGIGGFDLGLERAGMVCKWQVEIEPYCQQVLAKHWPSVRRYNDVRECGRHELEPVDLICGGFPCQPHSQAGKRRGAADDRNLWPDYRRIVAELRPRWVLGENVPGIRTTMLDQVLSDLEAEGYTCGTFNIPACAFDAPHRRARIFIIAHANGRRCEQRDAIIGAVPITDPGGDIAYANRPRQLQPEGTIQNERERIGDRSHDVANAEYNAVCDDQQHGGSDADAIRSLWMETESPVSRVADGVPHRVDRLRTLGNAVVPQVVEWIGRRIIETDVLLP